MTLGASARSRPARRTATPAAPATSREKLFEAATREFAARGFEGAKVDRIADQAGVNKAMLYYHFPNKAALYRDVLIDMFQSTGRAVRSVREAGGPPDAQIRAFIQAIAREGHARPHFPPMWLREVAEGGRHLDETIVKEMRGILLVLHEILDEGHARGVFSEASVLLTQIGIVAPLLFFLCSAGVRQRFTKVMPPGAPPPTLETVVAHLETMTLNALGAGARPARQPTKRRTRS